MINKLIIFVFLVVFWFIFSGKQEPFFLGAGLFACLMGLLVAIKLKLHQKLDVNSKFFTYSLWLIKEMALSTIQVLGKIWSPKLSLSPEFVTLKLGKEKDLFYAIYANSITLTPGTVTVLIEEKKNQITTHALVKTEEDDLKCGIMQAKIKEMIK